MKSYTLVKKYPLRLLPEWEAHICGRKITRMSDNVSMSVFTLIPFGYICVYCPSKVKTAQDKTENVFQDNYSRRSFGVNQCQEKR